MFCIPVRLLYRDTTIVSVFNWKMKDEKRKKCLFVWVEKITGENQISWLLRRYMQLRMCTTSDTWSLQMLLFYVAVTLARPLHVSKVGQSKKGKTKQATLISDFHADGRKSFLGRFVLREVNIDDVTIHPSRGSRINPTLKQDATTGEFRFNGAR